MSDVTGWATDRLYDVIGYSDKVVCEFVVAAAKRAASVEALAATLESSGTITDAAAGKRFATELYARVSRAAHTSGPSISKVTARQAIKASVAMQKRQQSYTMIEGLKLIVLLSVCYIDLSPLVNHGYFTDDDDDEPQVISKISGKSNRKRSARVRATDLDDKSPSRDTHALIQRGGSGAQHLKEDSEEDDDAIARHEAKRLKVYLHPQS